MRGLAAILLVGFVLTACIEQIEERGYTNKLANPDAIEPGFSKDQVLQLLGSPSTKSTFGNETWYYITSSLKQRPLQKSKLVNQQVFFVTFNEEQLVNNMGAYSMDDAKKIEFAKDETPTHGNEFTVMEQLLGNFGRFNPNSRRQVTP